MRALQRPAPELVAEVCPCQIDELQRLRIVGLVSNIY